jgi:SAM-dependent methyltransferase
LATDSWQLSLKEFFELRAREISEKPTIEDLSYISGRDPRIWLQENIYEDLIIDIVRQLHANCESNVLEVGCASGFIAYGLAPRVGKYFGVDLAKPALKVARRLRLGNAFFHLANGNKLTFVDHKFNSSLCYDVFTNLPSFKDGIGIIKEMLRVTKPGGCVLIGSIPDEELRNDYVAKVAIVNNDLELRFGPVDVRPSRKKDYWWPKLRAKFTKRVIPAISNYYFNRIDFLSLGNQLGVETEISDIHPLNPYAGYRFNIVYKKP